MLATMRAPAPRMGLTHLRHGGWPARPRPGPPAAAGAAGATASPDGGRLRLGVPPVVGEEVPPALAHRGRVGEVLLVHLVDEPGVGTEGVGAVGAGGGIVGHGTEATGPSIHHPDRAGR